MIGWISGWAQAIIIAVMIGTIIEMILPEGSSKKYIKVVVGVYIVFTIISPIITKFTGKSLAVSDILELDEYITTVKEKETTQNLLQEENSASIRDIYIGNLKTDIQNKLKGKGYKVIRIDLEVGNDDNYTLHKITLNLVKEEEKKQEATDNVEAEIGIINEISINISNKEIQSNEIEEATNIKLSNNEKKKIKEYLGSVYEISEKNIMIEK